MALFVWKKLENTQMSINRSTDKLWSTYTILKTNKLWLHISTLTNLKDIVLCEKQVSEKYMRYLYESENIVALDYIVYEYKVKV